MEEFTVWDIFAEDVTVYAYKDLGLVSVDYKKRCWEVGGTSLVRRIYGQPVYAGRGWKEKLEADAKAALKAIFEENL